MKQKEKKKEFRRSIRGYKKEDVNRYILSMDRTAKEDMLKCRQEFQEEKANWEAEKSELLKTLAQLQEEIASLREEAASLKKANAEGKRKQEEQFIAFAQLVADVTEMRKKLADYEKNDASAVSVTVSEETAEKDDLPAQKSDALPHETSLSHKTEPTPKAKTSSPIRFSYSVGKNVPLFPFKKTKN